MNNAKTGRLYVISAASGTGKTRLIKGLLTHVDNLMMSISYTTRAPRDEETAGVDYFFVDETTFGEMQHAEKFLEHAVVFGHRYGTAKSWIAETLAKGIDIMLELDWQGHRAVQDYYPEAIGIFILPPSKAILHERLTRRGQDSEAVIAHRMQQASQEISHYDEYDYLVVNQDFDTALDELKAIIQAARQDQSYPQSTPSELINSLLPE